MYLNYLGLAAEVGELGSELKRLWVAHQSGQLQAGRFVRARSAACGPCRLTQ